MYVFKFVRVSYIDLHLRVHVRVPFFVFCIEHKDGLQ